MTHWAQRARWIVAVAGGLFAVGLFFGIQHRKPPAAAPPIVPSDPQAAAEVTGATSRQWSGANENFTVTAERQLLYATGGVKLEDVTVYVDDRQGKRKFVATSREGEAGPKQDYVNLKGDVKLISSDGLKVEASEASYHTGEAIVRAPGRVTFSRGRMSGHGIGMTYDRNNNILSLQEQASIMVAPDDNGAGGLEATSGAASLARQDKYVRFERDVRILRDNRRIQTDSAVGHLSEDESHITALDLEGHSSVTTEGAASGGLEAMSAHAISLAYGEDGEHVERALLAGGASIRLAGDGQKPGRRVAGELLDVGLGPDGNTVTSLTGRDGVHLEFPADGRTPPRSVRAAVLDSASGGADALTGARLRDNVEYRELIGTPPVPRIVRARVLDLTFTSGMSAITDARFTGAVRLEEGDLRATANTARYDVDRGVIELQGDARTPPTVADARMTIDANQILLTVEGPKVAAMQAVRSVLRPGTSADQVAGGKGSPDQVKLPGFLDGNQPVNATADALDYDGTISRAVYDGNARLWQGDSAVQGDSITIDSKAGNLQATGSVRSTWLVEQTDEKTKDVKRTQTIAGAGNLDYDDQARRATYTVDAHVNGPQGDLVARTIELYLGRTGHELERVEGYETVTLRESGRAATGDRLSYFSGEDRYLMTGAPVRIVEECRESTGRTLTFYKSTDRILVDGQQVLRTRTKNGNDCAESSRTDRGPRRGSGAGDPDRPTGGR